MIAQVCARARSLAPFHNYVSLFRFIFRARARELARLRFTNKLRITCGPLFSDVARRESRKCNCARTFAVNELNLEFILENLEMEETRPP